MKKIEISIIIPRYKSDKILLNNLRKYLKENAKNIEIIEIEGSQGLANAYNRGIKKSKGKIIITLHQDCIPLEKNSVKKLVAPFKNSEIVMTYSWIFDYETKKRYFPFVPDGKFTAYRKEALEKVRLFDENTFFTGGEDVDIFLKLKRIGKIEKVNTTISHIHPGYLGNKTKEKRKQNGNINGVLFRIWGFKHPLWLKSIIMSIIHPFSYGKNFVSAFLSGKQTYRRKE